MSSKSDEMFDVVIVGAGLSGLTTALWVKKLAPALSVLVVERSGIAGGLTGDWIDHRFGPDKHLQPPMHMIFRKKYRNLLALIDEVEAEISPIFDSYHLITSDGKRHLFAMNDWFSKNLPPPFHAIGMLLKLQIPILAKWDLAKLAAVGASCVASAGRGDAEATAIPATLSLEGLELLLGMGKVARDWMETVTPSIYNPHPWYTSGARMAGVAAATLVIEKDCLHHNVYKKNYNAAIINRLVDRLRSIGVELRFHHEVRRIDSDKRGSKVEAIWCKVGGPEAEGAYRYICENCGNECFAVDRAFCTRCGTDTTLDALREGHITKRPAGSKLWADPEGQGLTRIGCKYLVTAMYPHMIAALLPKESPLRADPFVRSFFSSRHNQTQLSIGRVYYKEPVTEGEQIITGTHNPYLCFNGCQSVFNVFGADDLGWKGGGDVVDVLLDVGIIRDAHTHEVQKQRIVHDLKRVYPKADPRLVEHVSFADMQPSVLYLTEQPSIAGLHRFYNRHKTGAKNWFVAGCHSGHIGIGMESAVESGLTTTNILLEEEGVSARAPIVPIELPTGSRMLAGFGDLLLWWKTGGRDIKRLAASTYSMPPGSSSGGATPP
ncbi:MAG: FAD-dependent oxidoreductase [Byssovorax sp.]